MKDSRFHFFFQRPCFHFSFQRPLLSFLISKTSLSFVISKILLSFLPSFLLPWFIFGIHFYSSRCSTFWFFFFLLFLSSIDQSERHRQVGPVGHVGQVKLNEGEMKGEWREEWRGEKCKRVSSPRCTRLDIRIHNDSIEFFDIPLKFCCEKNVNARRGEIRQVLLMLCRLEKK